MKRDPYDPDGQYERVELPIKEIEDVFCARESYDAAKEWYDFVPPVEWTNPTITDLVHTALDEREKIGRATYNRPLFHTYHDLLHWLLESRAEKLDDVQYMTCAIEWVKDMIKREGRVD